MYACAASRAGTPQRPFHSARASPSPSPLKASGAFAPGYLAGTLVGMGSGAGGLVAGGVAALAADDGTERTFPQHQVG